MTGPRIAVTSKSFSAHAGLRKELLSRYENVTFNESAKIFKGAELIEFLKGHERAITGLDVLDESTFAAVPELRVVSKYGVGLDTIDLDAMRQRGVLLGWTGGVNRRSVAELAVAFAITLLHRVNSANQQIREGRWNQIRGRQLSGRTVGIVGCGHVGKDVAMLCRAFGCKILAYDLRNFPEFYSKYDVSPVGLDELLIESDVVTLHLPLDPSTQGILNAGRLALMRSDAILINTARGGLVEEPALKMMLQQGRLAGAGFDVFVTEPPGDLELLNHPNFLATPHIGGSTEEAIVAMGLAAIEGLECAAPIDDVLAREMARAGSGL